MLIIWILTSSEQPGLKQKIKRYGKCMKRWERDGQICQRNYQEDLYLLNFYFLGKHDKKQILFIYSKIIWKDIKSLLCSTK